MKIPDNSRKKAFLLLIGIALFLAIPAFCVTHALSFLVFTQNSISPDNPQTHNASNQGAPQKGQPRLLPTPTSIPAPLHATMTSFVGDWLAHVGSFSVKQNGHAFLVVRVYGQPCSPPKVKPPCDLEENGQIIDGIQEEMIFSSISGATAHALIVRSTTGDKGKSVAIILGENDTIEVRGFDTFCGPHSPMGYCGA
jgi:hypothetical protein